MAECGRQDRACRIAVIGPFLVEPGPMAAALPSAPLPASIPGLGPKMREWVDTVGSHATGPKPGNARTTFIAKTGATAGLDGR
jgi:hypothetical protein